MPIQSSSLLTSDYTQDDIEAAPEAVRSATVEQAKSDLLGPSILRAMELNAASSPGARGGGTYVKKYSADAAKQYMADAGLDGEFTFDREYNEPELRIMADRKRAELKRQSILARADQSKTAIAGRFGLTLATSFLDPLTVATAFVPVIGEAKYAQLLGKAGGAFGRAGVRATVGAAEGAVGAAITEPVIAGAKYQEQADYTLADSLLNIAVGTVLGGGLHTVGGLVKDALTPVSKVADIAKRIDETAPQIDPLETQLFSQIDAARGELTAADAEARRVAGELLDTESAALNTVAYSPEAKALDGKWSGLEQELASLRSINDKMATEVTKLYEPAALQTEVARLTADKAYVSDLRNRFKQRTVTDRIERQAKANIKAQREVLETQLDATRTQLADVQRNVDIVRQANAAQVRLDYIQRARMAGDTESILDALPQDVEPRIRARLSEAKQAASDFLNSEQVKALELKRAGGQVAAAPPQVREAALRSTVAQAVTGQPIEARPIFDRGTMKEAAARLNDPDQRPLSDPAAVQRADAAIKAGETADDATIERQIADLDEQIKAMEADAELTGRADMADIVATLRDELKQAESITREATGHARMLATCATRSAA